MITESGIHSAEDVALMHKNGIFGFLIGESLMRSEQPVPNPSCSLPTSLAPDRQARFSLSKAIVR